MVTQRTIVRPSRNSFRFDQSETLVLKNPSADLVLDTVRKKNESIVFDALEGKTVDPTGMVEQSGLRFSNYGFSRLCRALDVPKRFLDDMSKYNPSLAADVLNDSIHRNGKKHLIAIDGNVIEGVVTPSYARLENLHVAEAVTEVTDADKFSSLRLEGLRMRLNRLGDFGDISDWTNNKEIIKTLGFKKGDDLGGGIDVYNGEDGGKSFAVAAYIYRVLCENGMIGPASAGSENKKRLVHRGSGLREKAMVMIQRSQDMCQAYLEKMPIAASVALNALEQRELLSRLQQEFSLAFANRVMEKAAEEARDEGHEDAVSLYNVFNGVTFQAHRSTSLDRARVVETYASKMLDQGLRLTGFANN